jgi:CRISPR/Cas system type I-B associated protein Csh2 (Cas7 group RAMP superfamily)
MRNIRPRTFEEVVAAQDPTEMARLERGDRFVGEAASNDAEHFIRCPACGGWIDCRDLGHVFEHEGPLPHTAGDQPQ